MRPLLAWVGETSPFHLLTLVLEGRHVMARKFQVSGGQLVSERRKFTVTVSLALTATFFSQVFGSEKMGR
jgi:hypothetical protein